MNLLNEESSDDAAFDFFFFSVQKSLRIQMNCRIAEMQVLLFLALTLG